MASYQHTVEQRRAAEPWDLIAAAQAGDREAFGELYARYQPQIVRYIGSRVHDYQAAQDLAGDTFVKALRNLGSVSDQGTGQDPGAWLTTIARNVVLDHAKSARVRRELVTDDIPEPRAGDDQHTATGPEDRILTARRHATTRAAVAEAMRALTPEQRQSIELYEQNPPGQGLASVAEVMGRSVGAVKALRVRALAGMRAALSKHGVSSSEQVNDGLPDPVADSARAVARARVSVEQARDALREPVKQPAGYQANGYQASDELAELAEQAQQWQHHADHRDHAAGDLVHEGVA